MKRRTLIPIPGLLAPAVGLALVVAGCGSLPGFPNIPGFPGGPALEGRWFGTVLVEANTTRSSTLNLGGGATQRTTSVAETSVAIAVAEDGLRLTEAAAAHHFRQWDDIVLACFNKHATSITEASGGDRQTRGSSYFSLTDDGGGGFRFGETLLALVMAASQTTNHVLTETCDLSLVEESENEGPVLLGESVPLAQAGGPLSADGKGAVGSQTITMGESSFTITWSLKRDKEIVAEAGGPYTVERGQRLSLDASASRGQIDDYLWKVTPTDQCKNTGNPEIEVPLSVGTAVEHHGQKFEFVALCKLSVHLTVRGPAGSDDDDALTTVTPRVWRTTPIPSKVTPSPLDNSIAGTNRCAVEAQVTGHFLHQDDTLTWKGAGYTVKAIEQADSPFFGARYLASNNLRVTREEVLNTSYAPGGAVYRYNKIDRNNGRVADLLKPQIESHERAHTTLLFNWLRRHRGRLDPAQRIEGFMGMAELALAQAADLSLSADDQSLCKATQHPFVWPIVKAENPAFSTGPVTVYTIADQESVAQLYLLGNDRICAVR